MANYTNIVERAEALIPQTGDLALFTVVGRVQILELIGEVGTVAIGAVANASLLKVNPTVGADVDLCSSLDINGFTVGTLLTITGRVSDPLMSQASGGMVGLLVPLEIPDGVIEMECAANSVTGVIKWTIHYVPLEAHSYVTAVAIP